MMSAFLDGLGIVHENGLISDETSPSPDAASSRAAAPTSRRSFPTTTSSLYFSDARRTDPDTWGALAEHCQPFVGSR